MRQAVPSRHFVALCALALTLAGCAMFRPPEDETLFSKLGGEEEVTRLCGELGFGASRLMVRRRTSSRGVDMDMLWATRIFQYYVHAHRLAASGVPPSARVLGLAAV